MNKSAIFFVTLVLLALYAEAKLVSYKGFVDHLIQMNQATGRPADHVYLIISDMKGKVDEISANATS